MSRWIEDVLDRISFITEWIQSGGESGNIGCVWLAGMLSPESLCDALLSEYASAFNLSPDNTSLRLLCRAGLMEDEVLQAAKRPGAAALRGLRICGARWNDKTGVLRSTTKSSPG